MVRILDDGMLRKHEWKKNIFGEKKRFVTDLSQIKCRYTDIITDIAPCVRTCIWVTI